MVLDLGRNGRPPHRCKNANALQLGLVQSERLSKEKVAAAAKAIRLAKEQTPRSPPSAELPFSSESSGTSSDDPPDMDAYGEDFDAFYCRTRNAKGKCPTRKW